MQLKYWPYVMHAACYNVVDSTQAAATYFFIPVFDLVIANGAKVDLNLRLGEVNF